MITTSNANTTKNKTDRAAISSGIGGLPLSDSRRVSGPRGLGVHAEKVADLVPGQACVACHRDRGVKELLTRRLNVRIHANHRTQ